MLDKQPCGACFDLYCCMFCSVLLGEQHHAVQSPWFAPVMTLKTSAPLRYDQGCILHQLPRGPKELFVMIRSTNTQY